MNASYSKATFGRDFLASIVVFLVALPLCMGISIASGMPPTAGLITGIIGGIIVGIISGAPLQVSGPAAGLSVLVLQLVQQFGLRDDRRHRPVRRPRSSSSPACASSASGSAPCRPP